MSKKQEKAPKDAPPDPSPGPNDLPEPEKQAPPAPPAPALADEPPKPMQLIVTQDTILPGREFRAGEIVLRGESGPNINVARLTRLLRTGRVRAMTYGQTGPAPDRNQTPPPSSER